MTMNVKTEKGKVKAASKRAKVGSTKLNMKILFL